MSQGSCGVCIGFLCVYFIGKRFRAAHVNVNHIVFLVYMQHKYVRGGGKKLCKTHITSTTQQFGGDHHVACCIHIFIVTKSRRTK